VAKPIRVITQRQLLERFQISLPTALKYERLGLLPRARTVAGRTVYLEHEVDECLLNAPVRRLRGDGDNDDD
jgi:hypothetical protein